LKFLKIESDAIIGLHATSSYIILMYDNETL